MGKKYKSISDILKDYNGRVAEHAAELPPKEGAELWKRMNGGAGKRR